MNENFNIGTLLCETNAGSVRWFNGIDELPFAPTAQVGEAKAPSKGGIKCGL